MSSPDGGLSLSILHARKLLAACPTFQLLVSEVSETDALDHVYRNRLPDPESDGTHTLIELHGYRPYALVAPAPEDCYERRHGARGTESGQIVIYIERDVPESMTDAEADIDWCDTVSKIVDEMWNPIRSNAAGYLNVYEGAIRVAVGPYRNHQDDETDEGSIQAVYLELAW
jgi:hypothetical protein